VLIRLRNRLFAELLDKVRNELVSSGVREVYIYGAGQLGMELAIECEALDIKLKGFIDKARADEILWPNIPILPPQTLESFVNETVLVSVLRGRQDLVKHLRENNRKITVI